LATGASAGKPKPVLKLKKKGVIVPNNTAVGGGWTGAIVTEEKELPGETIYVYYGCESNGPFTLITNSSTTDKATGKVGIPNEECGEFEAVEETGAPAAKHLQRHFTRTRIRHHRAGSRRNVVGETVAVTGGELTGQEMTTKKAGTITLGKALAFSEVTGELKCNYISKTKLKGEWPVEEYPGTADIESEFAFKLNKTGSSKKGCDKAPEGYVETWVGPDFEELEAELAV
jgi:hypothetical protein